MAYVDYHHCVVCDGKAFYDANIEDPHYVSSWDKNAREFGYTEVRAICRNCTDKYQLVLRERSEGYLSELPGRREM